MYRRTPLSLYPRYPPPYIREWLSLSLSPSLSLESRVVKLGQSRQSLARGPRRAWGPVGWSAGTQAKTKRSTSEASEAIQRVDTAYSPTLHTQKGAQDSSARGLVSIYTRPIKCPSPEATILRRWLPNFPIGKAPPPFMIDC